LMLTFVSLAVLTLMNMLVGVLVEVMGAIAVTEKEGMTVSYLSGELRRIFANRELDAEKALTQREFKKLVVDPDAAFVIESVGVDVVQLVDMAHNLFEDLSKAGEIGFSFECLVELILNMRGTSPAKVNDMKVIKAIMKEIKDELREIRQAHTDHEDALSHPESDDDEDDDVAPDVASGLARRCLFETERARGRCMGPRISQSGCCSSRLWDVMQSAIKKTKNKNKAGYTSATASSAISPMISTPFLKPSVGALAAVSSATDSSAGASASTSTAAASFCGALAAASSSPASSAGTSAAASSDAAFAPGASTTSAAASSAAAVATGANAVASFAAAFAIDSSMTASSEISPMHSTYCLKTSVRAVAVVYAAADSSAGAPAATSTAAAASSLEALEDASSSPTSCELG